MRKCYFGLLIVGLVAAVVTRIGESRLVAAPSAAASAAPSSTTPIKEQRRKAAERRRRILFNNDGGDVVKQMSVPTAEDLLKQRTTALAGTQVDALAYSTEGVGLDVLTHFTKVGSLFTSTEGQYAKNQMAALLAKNIDPLRVMTDFGKAHDIEVFWSLRMNDNHDHSPKEQYGPILFKANKFKTAHPEYMLGTKDHPPKHGAWTALNYGRPEVREHAFQLLEEVCRNYDIDGIELDFFRHPVYFPSVARGENATDEEREAMTALMSRIRNMADEVGRSRGRPILIAVRIFDSAEYSRAAGLDLEKWLAADLLDLYIPGSYYQLNDWEYSVALGHKYGVKVYPSLDESRIQKVTPLSTRQTELAYRARAADVWRSGADGVYIFNAPGYFSSGAGMYKELGSPEVLASLDKDYFASYRGAKNASGGNLPFESYLKIETLNPDKPRTIRPGKSATARILIDEPTKSVAPASYSLRLQLKADDAADQVHVTFNGRALKLTRGPEDWCKAAPLASDLRQGRNTIEVALPATAKQPIVWSDAVLEVRHNQGQ